MGELGGIAVGMERNLLRLLAIAGPPRLHAAQSGQWDARQLTITDGPTGHPGIDKGHLLGCNADTPGYLHQQLILEALLVFRRTGDTDIAFELIRLGFKILPPTGIHPGHCP